MLEKLQHPKLNALILGVLNGLPQGLRLDEPRLFPVSQFDGQVQFLALFGLLAPPAMAGLNYLMTRGRYPRLWTVITKYIDPFLLIVWGSLSLGLSGFYALGGVTNPGYGLCVFFTAGGVGFFAAWLIEKRLTAGKVANAI
jgi:hypothetical protein